MTAIADWPEWAIGLLVAARAIAPAAGVAWLLRSARLLGAGGAACAVIGGVVAGLLVGPGVLGRVVPEAYSGVFNGAVDERATRQRLAREQAIEVAVMRSSDVTPEAIAELRDQHEAALAPLVRAEREALRARAGTIDAVGVALAAGALLAPYLLRAAGSSRRAMPARDRLRARLAGVIGAGLTIVAATGLLRGIGGVGWPTAASFGAICAAGWAAPGLRARRTGRAGRDPRTDQASSAALGASMLVGGAALSSVWLAIGAIPGLVGLRRVGGRRFARPVRRALHGLVYAVLAPGVCAAMTLRVDPYVIVGAGGRVLWVGLIVALVVSTDGRWFGALIGRLATGGRRALPAAMERATAMLASGVGVAQCALALALHSGGVIGDDLALGAIAGAVLVEAMIGAYRLVTRRVESALAEPAPG